MQNAQELIALITHAISIRATEATGVHDSSSRSHAILRIYMQMPGEDREGVLTLVDLAGSEQSIDSMYHTADRRKEGALINSSLLALKECVRARAEGQNESFHYRKSKLTMALKHSFVLPSARTVILATVSPASKDTEHSLNTLRHACLMNGEASDETRFITGGSVASVVVGEVDVSALGRQAVAARKAGKVIKEKNSNGNTFGAAVFGGATGKEDVEMTEKQRAKARRIADHRSLKALDPQHRTLLELHRQQLGGEEQQIRRQRRRPITFDDSLAAFDSAAAQSPIADAAGAACASSTVEASVASSTSSSDAQAHTQAQRRTFRKLVLSVYGEDADISKGSGDLQRRQLVTLMKIRGFTDAEIEAMAPPLRPEVVQLKQQQAVQWKAEKDVKPVRTFVLNMGIERPAPSQSRTQAQAPLSRQVHHAPSSSLSTFHLPTPDAAAASHSHSQHQALASAAKAVLDDASLREKRREDARLIREAREQQQREAILAKISKKKANLLSQTAAAAAALAAAEEAAAAAVAAGAPNSPLPAAPARQQGSSPSASPPHPYVAPETREDTIRRLQLQVSFSPFTPLFLWWHLHSLQCPTYHPPVRGGASAVRVRGQAARPPTPVGLGEGGTDARRAQDAGRHADCPCN